MIEDRKDTSELLTMAEGNRRGSSSSASRFNPRCLKVLIDIPQCHMSCDICQCDPHRRWLLLHARRSAGSLRGASSEVEGAKAPARGAQDVNSANLAQLLT